MSLPNPNPRCCAIRHDGWYCQRTCRTFTLHPRPTCATSLTVINRALRPREFSTTGGTRTPRVPDLHAVYLKPVAPAFNPRLAPGNRASDTSFNERLFSGRLSVLRSAGLGEAEMAGLSRSATPSELPSHVDCGRREVDVGPSQAKRLADPQSRPKRQAIATGRKVSPIASNRSATSPVESAHPSRTLVPSRPKPEPRASLTSSVAVINGADLRGPHRGPHAVAKIAHLACSVWCS
jgi:hypothetical protein